MAFAGASVHVEASCVQVVIKRGDVSEEHAVKMLSKDLGKSGAAILCALDCRNSQLIFPSRSMHVPAALGGCIS